MHNYKHTKKIIKVHDIYIYIYIYIKQKYRE